MQIDPEKGTVLIVNKPLGWTSFDVVNKLRYALLKNLHRFYPVSEGVKRKIKVGHAGTLDPLATGVLIVCAGKETRNIDQYMATEKEYTGTIYLGEETPSYDRETPVQATYPVAQITNAQIHEAAASFVGEQMQVPPVFSAIKKDGKKLYESARKGEEIQPDPRPIEIRAFEITGIEMPLVHFRVVCSKGTYIRSLAYDFGKALNSGACLHALCRTRSGNFGIADARSVDEWVAEINGSDELV